MTGGTLYTGCGGGDLAAQNVGIEVLWQVENNPFCIRLLEKRFPDVFRIRDITNQPERSRLWPVDIILGGDPCPIRSKARGSLPSNHPDLSGYFLAVVGQLWPGRVVRENVPAPDVYEFATALEYMGYGVVVLEINSARFTGQNRPRQYVIGSSEHSRRDLRNIFYQTAIHEFNCKASGKTQAPTAACLTSHLNRCTAEENYVYEDGRGLRVFSPEERERLQGFPVGWTAGFSASQRCRMMGNAMNVPTVQWILTVLQEL